MGGSQFSGGGSQLVLGEEGRIMEKLRVGKKFASFAVLSSISSTTDPFTVPRPTDN
jgi:hypothetical protein